MSVLGLKSGYIVKIVPEPSGFPSENPLGSGTYFTVYPSCRPNTDTICEGTNWHGMVSLMLH